MWVHSELLPGNLVLVDGRLSVVIDFGGLNVGDPAFDLLPALASVLVPRILPSPVAALRPLATGESGCRCALGEHPTVGAFDDDVHLDARAIPEVREGDRLVDGRRLAHELVDDERLEERPPVVDVATRVAESERAPAARPVSVTWSFGRRPAFADMPTVHPGSSVVR